MLQLAIYTLGVSLMLAHELDAIARHEWRVMPLLRSLPDTVGYQMFVWLHVPIMVIIFWFSFVNGGSTTFRAGFAIFCIIHVALHKYFERHPAYEFNSLSSKLLIWTAGLNGALYLGLQL